MKRIFTVLSCVFLASTVLEAQSWRQYEAAAADQAYQAADLVVLLDSTSVTVEPTGQGSFAVYKAFRVQTPAGALASRVIKYDYDPLTAFAEFSYVTVYRADGNVEHLDVSSALDYAAPARMIYWGARQIMIEVGALEPGDIVEYEIAKKGFTYALLASDGGVDAGSSAAVGMPAVGVSAGSTGGVERLAVSGSAGVAEGTAVARTPAIDVPAGGAGAERLAVSWNAGVADGPAIAGTPAIGVPVGSASVAAGDADDESRFIPPMRGQFYDIVPFWCSDPTVRKVYRVSFPMEKDVQFQFYQGECASSMRYEDGRKVYRFAVDDVMPFKSEPNMVDLFDAAPKLMLSTTPEWRDKSLWFNKVNEDYGSFEAYAPAQKKVDELIRGKETEMEKIAVLTHWVADNIRYSGISMGKGEGYTLHNTEMNYTDRCGVCKDIAGTLISFLRMAGFEAYPAMTMAGSRVESIPADHFNHCVAVVKLSDGTYIPLDPTWVPFCRELWSSAEQQQNYLPGVPEGSDLCQTPVSAPENHYVRIKAENVLAEDGTLKGTFTITAEGQSDLNIRRIFTTGFQSEWRNTMERQLLNVSPKARLVSVDYGKNPKDYQAAPIRITFRYEIPDYAIAADGVMLFRPMVMNNLYNSVRSYLRINTDLEEREHGFKDGCSRLVELDETLRIPDGYAMVSAPKSDSMQGSGADFSGSLVQEGNRIVLHNVLALKKRVYEVSDWDSFRNAVNAHKAYGEYVVIKK